MFTIILFSILIIISGSIAYMGDKLGSTLGKAKISLFGIRPKHTARFIAIVSGMLITATTIAIIAIFTEDGRILLAGAEKIRMELKENSIKIKSQQESLRVLNDEKVRLDGTVNELEAQKNTLLSQINEYKQISSNLANIREKKLIFSVNDILLSKNIEKDKSPKELVDGLLQELNSSLSKHKTGFWSNTGSKQRFYLPDKDYQNLIIDLNSSNSPLKIKILAKSNTFEGEFVPVRVISEPVTKLFDKNEIILSVKVKNTTSENDLIKYLQDAKNIMIQKGLSIEPNEQPYIDLTSFYNIRKEIKSLPVGKTMVLYIYATDNIYSRGPATVDMKIPAIKEETE